MLAEESMGLLMSKLQGNETSHNIERIYHVQIDENIVFMQDRELDESTDSEKRL